MKKYQKICIGIFTCAVSFTALYYAALISVPYVVDLNKYKENVIQEIEQQTGFKISCENIYFKKSLTPYFKIHLYHTLILYPDNEVFIKLKDADLEVKILPLLFRKIVIRNAKLIRPVINVTLYKDFSTSLEKYIDPGKALNTGGFVMDGIISDTVCERYKLKINDESSSKQFYLEGDELVIKDLKLNEKIHLIINGSLFENEKEYIKYNLDITSYLGIPEKQFNFSPFKPVSDYNVKGNVSGHLNIGKNNQLNGSLNLEDFSLKLDDNLLKNNSAKLLFKGEEVEIDSVLHTSQTDDAKIKGKFNYGKKKQIDLVTHAKNVNLKKLSEIISILSDSLNIPNEFRDYGITGMLDADFSVSSDFKKLKSDGVAKIVNAGVTHKSLPYKINKINSKINFNNNKIFIEEAQAYVNSTPVNISGCVNEDVSVDIKAASDNLDLNTIVSLFLKKDSLPVNLMRGKLSFVSDIKGRLGQVINADSVITLSDFNCVDKNTKLPVYAKKVLLKINNSNEKYKGEVVCSDFKTFVSGKPLSANELKISFDNKNLQIPSNSINIITSPVIVSGGISDYMNNPSGQISFSGNISAKDIADVLSAYVKEPYKAQGRIKTSGTVNFIKDDIKLKADLKADKDNYLSYLVIKELLNKPSFLKIEAEVNKDTVNIKDAYLAEDNGNKSEPRIKLNGQIKNTNEPIFQNVRIQIPEKITASTNFFGGEEISLNADVILNNTLKNPDIKGSAKIYYYNIKKLYTAIKNADVSISKDNIRIIAPDVQVNTSRLNLIADVVPKLSNEIIISNLQLNSLNMDLNTLFPMIQQERNPFASTVLNIKKGSATINDFKILDLKARDISADFSVKNNILKIEDISASAYGGSVAGSSSYDFNHAVLDINMIGKGLDIKESLYDLCKLQDNFAGKADFTSSVSMIAGDYNQVLKSLSGKVTFDASNGKMGTLGKFEYYMYAQNILYHGLLNATLNRIADAIAPDNTARFKQASGKLFLQNGYLITEEIKTMGPNMSLYIKGRHNLLTNQANIDIYGRISDEIKSKLGSFGDVSIAELVNGQSTKKNVSIMKIPNNIMSNIPELYNGKNEKTNTFKVNVYGNINSVSAINSFMWTVSEEETQNYLPEFSDMLQDL